MAERNADQPDDTLTALQIGRLRGYGGDDKRVARSAHVLISRYDIQSCGRLRGRNGANLYPAAVVYAKLGIDPNDRKGDK